MNEGINEFRTTDLYLATFLKTALVKLRKIERNNADTHGNKKATFVFEKDQNLHRLKMGYYNREEKVVALAFVEALRSIKNLLYSDQENDAPLGDSKA